MPNTTLPPELAPFITRLLFGKDNETDIEPSKPYLRQSVESTFGLIVFAYSVIMICGGFANVMLISYVCARKLYEDATVLFFLNNAISDLFKCIAVMPLSLFVLLVHNWVLGELLCSFLPMVQDLPLHTTTLTFILIALDRLRMVRHPTRPRLPALVCAVGTWLTSICLVLPYPIYILYIDLGKYIPGFEGAGLCIVNLSDDMLEYVRGIFLIMYAAPVATISYLHVRTTRELESHQAALPVVLYETRQARLRADSHSTTTEYRSARAADLDSSSQNSRSSSTRRVSASRPTYPDELDVAKERRNQKYMSAIISTYAVCILPLMLMRMARFVVVETYANTAHFDTSYITVTWLAYLPVCVTPMLFAWWQMSSCRRDRWLAFCGIKSAKLRNSCETVTSSAGTPRPRNRRDQRINSIYIQESSTSS